MAFTFPEFSTPIPIDAQRSWTATYESYDQRNDEVVYYIITLHEAGRDPVRFMARIPLYWAGDDWSGPEFLDELKKNIHRVAATGKTNTDYEGPLQYQRPKN